MIPETIRRGRTRFHASPWIIIGSVGILLIAVSVLAYQNYSREKKYMAQILTEKGAAIITLAANPSIASRTFWLMV